MADTMVSNGMRDLGYSLASLDDCWGYLRDPATGEYRADPDRFPSGIPALTAYLKARGFGLSVYTDSGNQTCESGGRPFPIPGSFGHYEQDAATFASWGVTGVKMDWCYTVINGTQQDPKILYPQMAAALNKTGVPIDFESCEWGVEDPWTWAAPYMNRWRIAEDHHDRWAGDTAPATEGIIETFAGKSKFAGPGGWNFGDLIYTAGAGCKGATNAS